MPPRRSSYASVAAGTATASPQSHTPVQSGAFSHLMNPASSASSHPQMPESEQHSQGTHQRSETSTAANERSNWGKGGGPTNHPSQYSFGGVYAVHNTVGSALGDFFVPSYLRESRYMENLESAYKARISTQKEAVLMHTGTSNVPLSANSSSVSLHRMQPSHRGMTYEIVENQPVVEDDGPAPLPSKWAEVDKYGGLEIISDGLDVRYTGPLRTHEHEAAAARADHPMPPQCGIYYYEVSILHKGKEGMIGIGFSGPRVSLERLPGYDSDSWGYHGDDGMTFCCQMTGRKYGPTFTTNDVVGCGVNFMTGCAFFTKNGVLIQGNAFRDLKDIKLYPSVGAKQPGAHLRANFGQMPFMFDIDGMMTREKSNIMADINLANIATLHPPLSEDALIKELISQFLRHDGYVDTAKAFMEEMSAETKALKSGSDAKTDTYTVQEDIDAINRQQIRAAILDGDIDKALKRTNAYYPDVLRQNPRVHFRLRCRKFVEMMRHSTELRNGNLEKRPKPVNGHTEEGYGQAMDLDEPMSNGDGWDEMETEDVGNSLRYEENLNETLRYSQELKIAYKDDPSKEVKDTLTAIFALFAYEDPRVSPIAAVMDQSGRVPVAEELNAAILVSLGKSSVAALERLCQQTEVLLGEISEQGGAGAFINMDHDFLR
ncbi:Ran-binding protein 9 [Trapelia coarctata]|nr:Ran-binding protein 9 [Trapelia coarctata]